MDGTKKLIVLSIVDYLRKETESGGHSKDCCESLDVAVQCIESAFNIHRNPPTNIEKCDVIDLGVLFQNELSRQQSCEPELEMRKQAEKYKNRGNVLMQLNRYQEALVEYNSAIKLYNKNAVYFCNRAAAYIKLNDHEKAIKNAKQAIELDPKYSKAYGWLGIAYTNLNQLQNAKEAYSKALQLDPGNTSFINNFNVTEEQLRQTTQMGTENQNPNSSSNENPNILSGIETLTDFIRNPAVINFATQIFANTTLAENLNAHRTETTAGSGANHLDGSETISNLISAAGRTLIEQVQNVTTSNMADQLRRMTTPEDGNVAQPKTNNPASKPDE